MPPLDLLRHRTTLVLRSALSHRVQLYSLLSLAAVSAVIFNALRNYSNFYSVTIYLSKSSRSVLVLANFIVLLALFGAHIVQRIFFGSLRANEVERLYDRLWFFITESLLAFTIFRDEFDIAFVLMFGFLLFAKSFHWLASDRVEWMDQQQYPGPPLLFHVRMASLFSILWLVDFIMFVVAMDHTIAYGVGGMVLFASEYGILMASLMNTVFKYLLFSYDLRRAGRRGGENAPPWEHKSMWVFYIELTTDFLKLTTYLIFFIIIITFYGLPLNIVRDVYVTARSFISRLRALHRYQTATRNMDQRYPNASEAELAAMSDRTCIICREDMVPVVQGQAPANDGPNVTPKKLPCGHIFHFYCLRSWLERQQSCPTWSVRQTVLEPNAPRRPVNGPAPAGQQQGNPPPVQPGNDAPVANNPIGNPLGLLRRILGPPAQGADRNPLTPPRAAQNAGANGGNNPIVIEYTIQYRTPQNNAQNTPANLRPVQPLERLPGPNGWQQWPGRRDNEDQAQMPPGPTPEQASTAPSGAVTSNAISADAQNSTDEKHGPENPRAAAALAALRRLNGNPETEPASIEASRLATPPTHQADTPHSSSASSTVPQYIPLFDLSQPQSFQGSLPRANRTTLRPFPAEPSLPSRPGNPLTQLPQHVTDAQLSLMDRLTRETIDERLRILESVSGTVYGCVEDLLRLRSALPVTETLNAGADKDDEHVSSSHGTEDDSFSRKSLDKGKGVDRSSGPELVEHPSSSTHASSSQQENGAECLAEI